MHSQRKPDDIFRSAFGKLATLRSFCKEGKNSECITLSVAL